MAPSPIDSHAHFDHLAGPDEVAATLARAQDAGVSRVGAIGATQGLGAARQLPELLAAHPDVLFGVAGVHPHDASQWSAQAQDELHALLIGTPGMRALGETGLDFHYDLSPREVQVQAFRDQLTLARALGLPVVLHVREAHPEARAILAELPPPGGVVHCFTGEPEDAAWYVDQGLHVSFSGILTFRAAEPIRQAARALPLDRILVETDSPYLAPVPHRGRPNEPALLPFVASVVASSRGEAPEELADLSRRNAEALFGVHR